jgi:ABC-type transport system involved in cytochrome bd biosynthesis fused ATPase/permease subunit
MNRRTPPSPPPKTRVNLGDIEAHEQTKGPINLTESTVMKGTAFAQVDYVEVQTNKEENPVLLHPMTVLFPESKVTAIMGPSGSGKSTLLNFVTGTLESPRC